MPELALIAGVAETGVIGDGETIPWHYDEDEKQYKDRVAGHPVVVGRTTWEGMTDIEGTHPIVVTGSPDEYEAAGTTFVSSVGEAVDAVAERSETGFVIGGQSVYAMVLPYADRAFVSELPEQQLGSRVFPYLGTDWSVAGRESYDQFEVVEYEHASPRPVPDPAQ